MIHSSQISVTESSMSSKTPASCISTITFDESNFHLLNQREDSSMEVSKTKHILTEEQDDKQAERADGSLYKRILNGLNEFNHQDSNGSNNRNHIVNDNLNEWRQVTEIHSGKVYFYNRQTRESSWTLPPGAVLTRRKNKRMGKSTNETNESHNLPCEVSMNSEDTSNVTMHSKVSDSYSNLLQKDHEESQMILERCRKLRNSFKYTERRKYFFPDTSRESNNEYANDIESSFDKYDTYHLNSSTEHFYCIYCGEKVSGAASMSDHLSNYHYEYKTGEAGVFTLENKALIQIMIKFWSETKDERNDVHVVDEKENINPNTQVKQPTFNDDDKMKLESSRWFGKDLKDSVDMISATSKMENDPAFKSFESYDTEHSSDEESTIFTKSKSLTQKYHKQSLKNDNVLEHGDSRISETKSLCPFCNKSFPSGSNLSSHLLSCKQRQSSNRKRLSNKQKCPSHVHLLQSGRKLPW